MLAISAVLFAGALCLNSFTSSPPPKPPTPRPAETDVARSEPKLDAFGDPLPEGAIARIGTSQFRLDGWYLTDIAFSADGKRVAATSAGHEFAIWETATGRAR